MKTSGQKTIFITLCRNVAASAVLIGLASMTSCVREDEELQRQLIELRAAVEAKNKSLEQVQTQVTDIQNQRARSGSSSGSGDELAKAKVKIAELEQRLAAVSANPSATPQIGKIDMDAMAEKLEDDLAHKARQLGELVQKQSPSSVIDEVSLKSISYPPQLITPFTSAITFTVVAQGGRTLRLMFPVSADLGGSWKLPTPDEIQKAYKAAQEPPAVVATGGGVQVPGAQAPQGSAGGGPRMSQRADGVYVFDWGDGSAAAQARSQPQQAYTQSPPPAGAQTFNNFTPPGQQGTPQQPSAPPAAPQAPSVPAPVMPVVGDRVIRFND